MSGWNVRDGTNGKRPYADLWKVASDWLENKEIWYDGPLQEVDFEQMKTMFDGYRKTMGKGTDSGPPSGQAAEEAEKADSEVVVGVGVHLGQRTLHSPQTLDPRSVARLWQQTSRLAHRAAVEAATVEG